MIDFPTARSNQSSAKIVNYILRGFIEFKASDIIEEYEMHHEVSGDCLSNLFPDYLIREDTENCIDVLRDLLAWVEDSYFHPIDGLHKYALFQIIQSMYEDFDELGAEGDEMRTAFFTVGPPADLSPTTLEWINMLENSEEELYDLVFTDTDFIDIPNIINLYQSGIPIDTFMGIDLNSYLTLLPIDIRSEVEKQIKYKEELKSTPIIINECLLEVTKSLSIKPRLLIDKSEEEIDAQFALALSFALKASGITVSQEAPAGFAAAKTGETDFFLTDDKTGPSPIAIGEGKFWGKYKKQVLQLFAYLNENVPFGFTLVINKNTPLQNITSKQNKTLRAVATESGFPVKDMLDITPFCFMSIHSNPETGDDLVLSHLVLNLFRPEREDAARRR